VPAALPTPAAAARWLASDQTSRPLLDEAVAALLSSPEKGFTWLGGQLARTDAEQSFRKGVDSLVVHATLEFVRRQRTCGMRFDGQYLPLRHAQPRVGEFLFELLLDTPEWYPHTHRVHLIRPLRELQTTPPAEPQLGRIIAMAEDAAREPDNLRHALAALLWQWGHKELAQQALETLQRASGEGDAAARVGSLLELAEFQYELRDYRGAAATHRSVFALATSSEIELKPIDHYASACAHALAGDVERSITSLQRCAERLASPDLDSSHRLTRELFEKDPELAAVRRDPRWTAIVARAFGADGTGR